MTYDHSGCKEGDPCPKCGHDIIVFHGGNAPCFHVDENHEEAARARVRRKPYPETPFCDCDGPGEAWEKVS